MNSPALGLLLDVDGPIASPVTRTVAIDSIAHDLVALANAGNPVIFNTGRSDAFIRDVVLDVMVAAGLEPGAPVHAICEKGATWFSIVDGVAGATQVDPELQVPADLGAFVRDLVEQRFSDTMFWDDTKLTMISVEQRVEVPSETYHRAQAEFNAIVAERMREQGLDSRLRLDPSIISTDVEDARVGKDMGARRAIELLQSFGVPKVWRTAGDSRSDYAMADWLHEAGYEVEHLDVRPADGVPETPYAVRMHDSLIHDDAAAVFLTEWRGEFTSPR